MNTLIVDDESCVLSSLTLLLEDKGCRVTTAKNGTEAVKIISKKEKQGELFDLVIADIHMPLLNKAAPRQRLNPSLHSRHFP